MIKNDKDFSINYDKEFIDYFIISNKSLYFTFKEYNYIRSSYSEKIKYFNYNNNNLKQKIFMYYPDIILSGFNFFFRCDEISNTKYKLLLYLFTLTYKAFKDKNVYDNILEHLLNNIILRNIYILNDINSELEFIYNILIAKEVNTDKIQIHPNILTLFINHYQKRMKDYKINLEYYTNNKYFVSSFHIMLCYSIQKNLPQKAYLFEMYTKKYLSNNSNIIDILKKMFTYNDFYENYNECIDFILLWTYILLSYFKENTDKSIDEKNYYSFKSLIFNNNNNNPETEADDKNNNYTDEKMETTNDNKDIIIKNMIENNNKLLNNDLYNINSFELIKNVIFYKKNYSKINQIFTSFFVQLWSSLKMKDKEILKVIINEFIDNYLRKVKNKNNYFLNVLITTFSQCNPLIIIKPEIISSLVHNTNNWTMVIFYLEHLITSGIEIPNSYHSLLYIYDYIKEPNLEYGLKKFFSMNNMTKYGISHMQNKNYLDAENLFYNCFEELYSSLEKINLDESNSHENNYQDSYLKYLDINLFKDLSTWETGLIESYKKQNKYKNIVKIEQITNNESLKTDIIWDNEGEKLDDIILNYQNNNNNRKYSYDNSITKKFNNIQNIQNIILSNIQKEKYSKNNNNYINLNKSLLSFIHEYYKLPKNCENCITYYFSLLQIIVNEYHDTNLLQALKLNTNNDNTHLKNYFSDYFFMLKHTTPKISMEFNIFKKIINQRNNLINLIENKDNNINSGIKSYNQASILGCARNLKIYETFYEYYQKFENENNQNKFGLFNSNTADLYFKDIEYLKFIKKCSHNYDLGITLCEQYLRDFNKMEEKAKNISFIKYIENNINRYKAYFYYRNGDIINAHKIFLNILENNKGAEINDYHIYYDWGILCENISIMIKNEPDVDEWFENTINNYLYSIIYGIKNSKFTIPILINYIKEFKDVKFNKKMNFECEINNIPSWIWIFWISVIYDNFMYLKDNSDMNNFYFDILKKLANNHRQIVYYWNNIYTTIYEENNIKNKIIIINDNIIQKYKLLINIIKKGDKVNNDLSKINVIINDIEQKLNINNNDKDNNNKSWEELTYETMTHLDLNSIEFPGYYNNKIIQTYEEEKLFIKNLTYQYINNKEIKLDLSLTASNEKIYKFNVKRGQFKMDMNYKLSLFKILLNNLYTKDIYASKSVLSFIVPITFYLTNTLKIEQVLDNNLDMEQIYEFCLQKLGYPSNISEIILDLEKNKINNNNKNEIIYDKMCEIIPQDTLKNFIHKIIMNYDDLFIYRKNFMNSFSIQSFLNYLICDKMYISNISINKQTGSLTINNNITNFVKNDSNTIVYDEEKNNIIRLSKNISYFISEPGIYGVIPNVFYTLSDTLINREKKTINIFKLFFYNESDNYLFKLKYLINKNIDDDNDNHNDVDDNNNNNDKMEIEEENKNNISNGIKENDKNHSMTKINKIIDNSVDEDILKKEDIELQLWF